MMGDTHVMKRGHMEHEALFPAKNRENIFKCWLLHLNSAGQGLRA